MSSRPLDVLAVGDGFIPASAYRRALEQARALDEIVLSEMELPGSKADHHAAQQEMEIRGSDAADPPAQLLDAVADAEVLCLHFAPVGPRVLAAAGRLRLVAVARSGLENVDVPGATRAGIGVVPALGRNAGAVAELQIGLLLAEARDIARADASVKAGGWRKEFPGARVELAGRTVGMVGFGHVGRAFAQRLSGFGCVLRAYDPYADEEDLRTAGVQRVEELADVFRGADVVVVQARLTPQTERLVRAEHLALLPAHAYFVNVSRSRLVDMDALFTVLVDGRIAGAGLDVFDEEPLPAASRWRTLDNVTVTTHFGGDTVDTNRISAELVAGAVVEFARTGRVAGAVNATELGWR